VLCKLSLEEAVKMLSKGGEVGEVGREVQTKETAIQS
jgi:hypothetical protein